MAKRGFGRFIQEAWDQDLVEYALLVAFVSLGSLVAVQSLGPVVSVSTAC
jgi:Flp pilus assembly pilin Flp